MSAAWIKDYNDLASRRQVLILIDTVEIIQEMDVFRELLETLRTMKNTLVLLAGRRGAKLRETLVERNFGTETIFLRALDRFTFNEMRAYVQQMPMRRAIDDEMLAKIHLLSDGRPVLIDLAVEWYERELLPRELIDYPRSLLESLSDPARLQEPQRATELRIFLKVEPHQAGTLEALRQAAEKHWNESLLPKFEYQLVQQVLNLERSHNLVILYMAHIYRFFNREILCYLTGLDPAVAQGVLDELSLLTFVKPRPGEVYALHDEMRQLVNRHDWPHIDPFGTERHLIDKRMIDYYQERCTLLDQAIPAVYVEAQRAATAPDRQKINESERQLLVAHLEMLFHTLRVDSDGGHRQVMQAFDQGRKPHYRYERQLGELALQLLTSGEVKLHFSEGQKFENEMSRARAVLDQHNAEYARTLLLDLLDQYHDREPVSREIEVLKTLSDVVFRLGMPHEAILHLEHAQTICDRHPEEERSLKGEVLNLLGRMYRQVGNYNGASRCLYAAIDLIKAVGDERQLAAAYNNLGYTVGLTNNYPGAVRFCERALAIQERLGLTFDQGRTHNTLGMVHRGMGQFDRALDHANQAIAIFEQLGSEEWLIQVYCERGTTLWHRSQLDLARADLEHSAELARARDSRNYLGNVLHALGHVAWEQGRLEEAVKLFEESSEFARQISDIRQTVNCLQGLVEVYYDMGRSAADDTTREDYYHEAERLAEEWHKEFELSDTYNFPLYSGSRLRILGDIACDRGEFAQALQFYKEAYNRIAVRSGYSRYVLPAQLKHLDQRLDALPPILALQWCDEIEDYWMYLGRTAEFPEMVTFCAEARTRARDRMAAELATLKSDT